VIKRLGLFLAGAVVLWGVTFALGWVLWPEQRDSLPACSVTALGLCLVPTTLTFLWSVWGLKQTPDQQLAVVLGGTGVRMFFVLGVGLLLSTTVAYFHEHALQFWLWVLLYYLATLALEMILIVRAQVRTDKGRPVGQPTSVAQ